MYPAESTPAAGFCVRKYTLLCHVRGVRLRRGRERTPRGLRRDSAETPQGSHQRLQLMSALLGALCCTLFCTSEALVHRFVRKRRQTFGTPMKHRCKYANKSTLYIALSMCAYQNLMERILFYSTGPQKTFGTPMKRTCKYANMPGLPVCPVTEYFGFFARCVSAR